MVQSPNQRGEANDDSELLEEIARITPSNEILLKLAEIQKPPQRWYEEDFEKLGLVDKFLG